MRDVFQRSIAPTDATQTLPFARPELFGAGIAGAVGDAAANVARQETADKALETQLERDKQASAASLQFARIQEEANQYALDQQEEAELGGAGYTGTIEAFLQDKESEFLGSIGDDRVRQVMAERFGRWRAQSISSAQAWEAGQGVRLAVDNHQQVTNIRANQARRVASPDEFTALLAEHQIDIEMLEGVPANVRQALLREGISELSVGFIQGRPAGEREALLDSGLFDQLDPRVTEQLRNGAQVDLRREEIERKAAERARLSEISDQIDGVLADLGDGLPISLEQLEELEGIARANGLEDEAKDLFDGRVVTQANQEFESAGFVAIDQEVKRLNRIISEAGNDAKRATIVRRDHLAQLRSKRRTMIEQDPAEFASRIGIAWEPLEIGEDGAVSPESIEARRQVANATAAAAGMPVQLLTDSEAAQISANLETPVGRELALQAARAFGRDAGAVIDQLAPDNVLLKHLIGLGPRARGYALEGQQLLDNGAYKAPSDLTAFINERLGDVLDGRHVDMRIGTIETVRALYAAEMSRQADPGEEVDEDVLERMVNRALGRTNSGSGEAKGPGGIGTFNGNEILLPQNMTSEDFEDRMFNISSTRGFFWGDRETPITPNQLREQYRPVSIGGTRYQFAGPNGTWALNRDGRRAVLNIGRIRPGQGRPFTGREKVEWRRRQERGEQRMRARQ